MNRAAARRRRAFTIIELLVVIGILAVLSSLSLTGVQAARETARSTKCQSNLREICYTALNYTLAHNGNMPFNVGDGELTSKEQSVVNDLLPHCGHSPGIFECPGDFGSLEDSTPMWVTMGSSYKFEGRALSERAIPQRTVQEWDSKKGNWKTSVKKAKPEVIRTLSQHVRGLDVKKAIEGKTLKPEDMIGMGQIPLARDMLEPWKGMETKSNALRGIYTLVPWHGDAMHVVFVNGQIMQVTSKEDWNLLRGKNPESGDD